MDKTALIHALKEQLTERQIANVCDALLVLFNQHQDPEIKTWETVVLLQLSNHNDLRHREKIGIMSRPNIRQEDAQINENLIQTIHYLEETEIVFSEEKIQAATKILASPESQAPIASQQQGLGELYQYNCDRKDQDREFRFERPSPTTRSSHFFCLHGDKQQSHRGLVNRFYLKYLKGNDDQNEGKLGRKVLLEEAHELHLYQTELRFKLFEAFNLKPDYLPPEDLTLANLISQVRERFDYQPPSLAVEFRIRSNSWKAFTPELIRWFSQDFCAESMLPDKPKPPQMYFFLSVIYHEPTVVKKKGLARFFSRSKPEVDPNEKLREAVKALPGCQILTELAPVSWTDLEIWVERHLIDDSNPHKIDKLLEEYFPDRRDSYDMAEVELRLEKIIAAHNQEKDT